jgi:2,5-diketo-D-gluconate reductase B
MHLVDANGAHIPALGFGTWELRGATAQSMVETALEIGYRHIDTAQMYGNEAEVGAAIRASGLPREDIFLTTKIWPERFRAGEFERAVEESMLALKLGWADLLLLHWPNPAVPLSETLPVLEGIKGRGLAKHIGVSNFNTRLLDESVRIARTPIVTNQVEYHPFLTQHRLLERQRQLGIALTAYCPLARGRVFGNPVLERIGQQHGRNVGQVALRWLVQQQGVIAIPRTSTPQNARTNFEIFDFELTDEEMREIHGLGSPEGRVVNNPGYAPEWDAD